MAVFTCHEGQLYAEDLLPDKTAVQTRTAGACAAEIASSYNTTSGIRKHPGIDELIDLDLS